LLLGGLGRLDLVEGLPFYVTIFTSHNVSAHITLTSRLDDNNGDGQREFYRKHAGGLLAPPYTFERYEELGLDRGTRIMFDIHGRGWMEASDDIVFPGIGWVAITGCGKCRVRAIMSVGTNDVPVRAYAREPLLPLEVVHSRKRFFGGSPRKHRRILSSPNNIPDISEDSNREITYDADFIDNDDHEIEMNETQFQSSSSSS
jgi:hypothetical protein